jgi:hypothetical protein
MVKLPEDPIEAIKSKFKYLGMILFLISKDIHQEELKYD